MRIAQTLISKHAAYGKRQLTCMGMFLNLLKIAQIGHQLPSEKSESNQFNGRWLYLAPAFLLSLRLAPLAWSAPPVSEPLEIMTVRGIADPLSPLTPVADQVISLEDRSLRLETIGDIINEVPGVNLFRQGGLGASQYLSIRGADFDQTLVLIDDVPLTGPDRGAVDFSLLPTNGFRKIELYRGSAPIRYGMGTIGGVVRLVPKEGRDNQLTIRVTAASFTTLGLNIEGQGGIGPVSLLAAGGGQYAKNNFRYNDDGITFADRSDDTVSTRRNADVTQGNGLLSLSWTHGPHHLALLGMMVSQERGLPGPATVISLESRQQRNRWLTSLGYRFRTQHPNHPFDGFVTVAVGLDEDRVIDPLGRIGLGREDSRDRYVNANVRLGGFVQILSWWNLGGSAFLRHDDIQPNNRFATPGDQPSAREVMTAAGESLFSGQWKEVNLSLRSSVAAQITQARLTRSRLQEVVFRDTQDVSPNYRLEFTADFPSDWTLSAMLTSGAKIPTTLQLFGNRDTITPNTNLSPERSLSADFGLSWKQALNWFSLHTETRVFWLRVQDIIIARRSARNTISFTNEREGETWGIEGWLSASVRSILKSTTSLTLLRPIFTYQGRERNQPMRVPLHLFQRLESTFWLDTLSAYAEFDYRSEFYTDSANQVQQAPYSVINFGLRANLTRYRMSITASVQNLLDEFGLDLLAFPRPGRSYQLTIQWRI